MVMSDIILSYNIRRNMVMDKPTLPDKRKSSLDISDKRILTIVGISIFSFFGFMFASVYFIMNNESVKHPLFATMAWLVLFISFGYMILQLMSFLGGIHPSRMWQYFRFVQNGKID